MKAQDNNSHRCQQYSFLAGNTAIFSWSRVFDEMCRFIVLFKQTILYRKIDISDDKRPIYAHTIFLVSRVFKLSRVYFHSEREHHLKMAIRKNNMLKHDEKH